MKDDEIWRDVIGWEGLYVVSNTGKVVSLPRMTMCSNGAKLTVNGCLLKQQDDGNGYMRVCLRNDGRKLMVKVHRLVAMHFIPNPENKPHINHKNFIRSDNRVENLEWCTHLENMRHAHSKQGRVYAKSALGITGELNWKSKPIAMLSVEGIYIRRYANARDADRDGVTHASHIYDVCAGKRKTAGGYKWMYYDDYLKLKDTGA